MNTDARKPAEQSVDEPKIAQLVKQLTLEEKASLCSGRDDWSTQPIERLDIPGVWLSDGPHGLRRAPTTDCPGYGDQLPATCFPTASALAATWDPDLLFSVGQALGDECQAQGVGVLLGPGVNIRRHPLGGRNFEYFSEDPVLAGELAAALANGIQSRGIGTSLKHFALNNEETNRMLMSSEADERTMRELYLVPFEIVVKKAKPWTVMACYSRVNGTYGTQNKSLLTDILRKEWGFEGIVISDWISVVDRVAALKAGLNIEMPGMGSVNDDLIVAAVKNGSLDVSVLDALVTQILRFVLKAKSLQERGAILAVEEHHAFARRVAGEAVTLLKNDNQTLPITRKYKTVAVIGEFARKPRYQGNGSSEVKPTQIDIPYDEIAALAGDDWRLLYSPGYSLTDDSDLSLIENAVRTAASADIAIVFAGLPSQYESEGIDRKHMNLPESHDRLIAAIAAVQPSTAVVLVNGSAVAMPWCADVPAVMETWLGGQASGGAAADTLFGRVNPSGKLVESFPVRLEDTPGFFNFPGEERKILYGERMFVGYRYYDLKKIEPLFPFGHGLSYTKFEYSGLKVSTNDFSDTDSITVSVMVQNTGAVAGKETVQLYVGDRVSRLVRPKKELKRFAKIALGSGEKREVRFVLAFRDFACYDSFRHMWIAESGEFDILIGSSSRDIRQSLTVTLKSAQRVPFAFDEYTFFREFLETPATRELTLEYFRDWLLALAPGQTDPDKVTVIDFFADMPLVKFPYITKGIVSREKVAEFLRQAQALDV